MFEIFVMHVTLEDYSEITANGWAEQAGVHRASDPDPTRTVNN